MAWPSDRSAQVATISVGSIAVLGVGLALVLNQIDTFDARNTVGISTLAVLILASLCILAVSVGRYIQPSAGMSTATRSTRQWLAGSTIAISTVGLFALAIVVIFRSACADDRMQVFTTLVPVFASWVGTVLAFYFGRESFVAANKQVSRLISGQSVSQSLSNVAVRSAMTPVGEVSLFPTEADPELITVSDMEGELGGHSRLPITTEDRHPRYLIHKSMIDQFKDRPHPDEPEPKRYGVSATLADLARRSERSFEAGSGFAVLAATDTLQDVADAFKQEGIEDVIVTEHGHMNEPVIGLLTDKKLDKYRVAPT